MIVGVLAYLGNLVYLLNRAEKGRQRQLTKKSRRLAPAGGKPTGKAPDIQQALDLAVQHHTQGRLPEAERIYQQILQADPNQPVALNLLGVISHQVGKKDIAVDFITKALANKPDYAEAHNNLGNALQDLGELDEAVASYQKALVIKPGFAEAHNNLGAVLNKLGKLDEAVESYHKALAIKPDFAEVHANLGNTLGMIGDTTGAVKSLRKAVDLDPNSGRALYRLGIQFLKEGQLDQAVACLKNMLERDYQFAEITFKSDKTLDRFAEYMDSQPTSLKSLDNLKVFHRSDLKEYCAKSKTEFKIMDSIKFHPYGSGLTNPDEDHPLFLAELKDCGVLGGSCLPVTRSGHVFCDQLIHNMEYFISDPVLQKMGSVILVNEKQLVAVADKEKDYSGSHLLIGSSGNFGHWLLNHFSRLMLVKDQEDMKSLPVVVGSELSGPRLECLSRIGYDEKRIIRVPPGQISWFEHLWVPSFLQCRHPKRDVLMWTPEAIQFIRSVLGVPLVRCEDKPPRSLFITRQNEKWRRLQNEDKLFAAIQPFGFEIIDPANFSLEEQIKLASEAYIIMGTFGAGMNLHQFAPRGTHVVELKLNRDEMNIHPGIALEIGQFHYSVFCEMVNSSDPPLDADLVAPIDEVVSLVKLLSENT